MQADPEAPPLEYLRQLREEGVRLGESTFYRVYRLEQKKLPVELMVRFAGVSHATVRAWLSVLEASFVVFRLPRWHRNLRKRAVKAPKLHFVDSGVACHLLGIRSAEQLRVHPLRGARFESWVAAVVRKARLHRGRPADLFHLREDRGLELDLVAEAAAEVIGLEVKSGATLAPDFFPHLREFAARVADQYPHLSARLRLVYGGSGEQTRHGVQVLPWSRVQDAQW